MKLLNVLVLSCFIAGCAIAQPPLELSDHYDGTRFYNQNREINGRKSLLEVLKWKCGEKETEEEIERPQAATILSLPSTIPKDEAVITFINHATALIQLEGLTVLTDPVFSEYLGPFSFIGLGRYQKPGLDLNDLPKIDLVIISHNHYDHLDLPSIKRILERDNPLFVVPLKNGSLLQEVGVQKIIELDWWQGHTLHPKHKVFLTPAQHWSARGLFDSSEALWGGFLIISDEIKVFFSGDTGYARHFEEIYQRFGAMDVSLLPIGCYKPRWFMRDVHMDPDDAVKAHLDLHSALSMGIHFGTFKLADDGVNQPVVDLDLALKNREVSSSQFIAPLNGETLYYKKMDHPKEITG
jgi:L-ascorbate metabolism protein UlaG (beta-lactamase superfamily)